MNILTVCGMGNGSSLILKINVDDILRSLDLKATVENVDVASFKSIPANMIFGTKDLGQSLKDAVVPVYLIDTVLDKVKIKESLLDYKEKYGWD